MNEEFRDRLNQIYVDAIVEEDNIRNSVSNKIQKMFNIAFPGSAEYAVIEYKGMRIGPIARNTISYRINEEGHNRYTADIIIQGITIPFIDITDIQCFEDKESAELYSRVV